MIPAPFGMGLLWEILKTGTSINFEERIGKNNLIPSHEKIKDMMQYIAIKFYSLKNLYLKDRLN